MDCFLYFSTDTQFIIWNYNCIIFFGEVLWMKKGRITIKLNQVGSTWMLYWPKITMMTLRYFAQRDFAKPPLLCHHNKVGGRGNDFGCANHADKEGFGRVVASCLPPPSPSSSSPAQHRLRLIQLEFLYQSSDKNYQWPVPRFVMHFMWASFDVGG